MAESEIKDIKNNISHLLPEMAEKYAEKTALYKPVKDSWEEMSFRELEELSNLCASAFSSQGIVRGSKVLLMLRPGFEFIAAVFALFKTASVPVLIDPGMGMKNLLNCIKETAPEYLIAVSEVHWISKLFPSSFTSVRKKISAGKMPPPGTIRLEQIIENASKGFTPEAVLPEDTAAILYTTGSTGPPKGVIYTHRIFSSQIEIIREAYSPGPDMVDMPAFPLFALFSAAMGMPCALPRMNPSRPAKADPRKIVHCIKSRNVSFSFASPALWRNVARYCLKNNIRLDSLKRVLMAGAPVPEDLHAMLKKITAPDAETMVPYGATEALPAASFNGTEMLSETAEKTASGEGYCVGYPLKYVTIKIIKLTNEPIDEWDEKLVLPNMERGEIVVKGPIVTPCYYNKPEHTKQAKIKDTDGKLWHRMGDAGYIDEKGRLWFCGRKSHIVRTDGKIYYPVCCEAIFNRHPNVFRTALVGVSKNGKTVPALVIEPEKGAWPRSLSARKNFIQEMKKLGAEKDFTSDIEIFLFHKSFPVDIRHNAKIFREKLALWGEKQRLDS